MPPSLEEVCLAPERDDEHSSLVCEEAQQKWSQLQRRSTEHRVTQRIHHTQQCDSCIDVIPLSM